MSEGGGATKTKKHPTTEPFNELAIWLNTITLVRFEQRFDTMTLVRFEQSFHTMTLVRVDAWNTPAQCNQYELLVHNIRNVSVYKLRTQIVSL